MSEQIKICCITNRQLCTQDYFAQIRQIARSCPKALIVREKDLPEAEYEKLAEKVMQVCAPYPVRCILHTYTDAALRLGAEAVHLPLPLLLSLPEKKKSSFRVLGASVHSVEEAVLAQNAGATYLTAGHIFATDCKRGLPPKGSSFLREVCAATKLPVYALGGIRQENAAACIQAGAYGVCMMSACMQRTDWSSGFAEWKM